MKEPVEAFGCLMLTQRLANTLGQDPVFPEIYYCPQCHDYFGLAWVPKIAPEARTLEAVARTPLPTDQSVVDIAVFCPSCLTSLTTYGFVPLGVPDSARKAPLAWYCCRCGRYSDPPTASSCPACKAPRPLRTPMATEWMCKACGRGTPGCPEYCEWCGAAFGAPPPPANLIA